MRTISTVGIANMLDLDYGEGYIGFFWMDEFGIGRSLTIDADGHCSREMPIRSGSGVAIVSIHRDRARLRFTEELAAKLELDREIEFEGVIPENTRADLSRFADVL